MSVVPVVEIKCDGPHGGLCPVAAVWSDYGTAASLRASMRAYGWATGLRFGRDCCPICRDDAAGVR